MVLTNLPSLRKGRTRDAELSAHTDVEVVLDGVRYGGEHPAVVHVAAGETGSQHPAMAVGEGVDRCGQPAAGPADRVLPGLGQQSSRFSRATYANERRIDVPCISSALIIGGGIAGLSASIALSRVGVHCEVVELAAEPLGASLGINGRAAEALDELGVYDECFANSTQWHPGSTALTQMGPDGTVLSAGPSRPRWPGAKTGMGIYRPILLQILADTADSLGVKIHKGVTTQSIEEDEDSSVVTLTTGGQGRYDMVIGADGIGSATRAAIFPDASTPTYAGQLSLRWMAPGPPVEPEGWYLGPVGRLGFYNLPQDLVYIPAVIDSPERVRLSDEEVHELFTRLLDSYTAPAVVELRSRLTPDSKLICRPFEWISLPAPWFRGRTLLIGDAAHATTAHLGQGGGMAMEDAVVLGQCIAAAPTLPEAFEAFMSRRYERTRTVVETSVELSRLEQQRAPHSANVALIEKALHTLAQPY